MQNHLNINVITVALLLLTTVACLERIDETSPIPEQMRELDNLIVYPSSVDAPDTVMFTKEQVFTSTVEVLIKGYIGDVAVDMQNRVYIAAARMGELGIYVFTPDGRHITTLARFGQGPGEFTSINTMDFKNNQLFVYDPRQYKITAFSLDDFSITYETLVRRDSVKNNNKLAQMAPTGHFSVRNDTTFLIGFKESNLKEINRNRDLLYYKISESGQIQLGHILQLRRHYYYTSASSANVPMVMPFSRSSLLAISKDGSMYSNWTENFLIKVYGKNGRYLRAFYYPYRNSKLSIQDVELSEPERDRINENESHVPNTWPALHTMEIDDQNRLWVFNITDSKMTYSGKVLSKEGKLLATFTWPGYRSDRNVISKPTIVIKNGYLYMKEVDVREGINRVVKHRIEFKKRVLK